jgi:demethylmenaquinone methyltransferase / 2-methoxy-6-polyprenyl-1,4-benzoquinol methylase
MHNGGFIKISKKCTALNQYPVPSTQYLVPRINTFALMREVLPHDHILPQKESRLSKKHQVAEMFNCIAARYDFMNRLLSVGIDTVWRKKAIRKLKKDDPKVILDVACGTADMSILACKMLNPDKLIGIDLSREMLHVGRQKIVKEQLTAKIELQEGDSEAIKFSNYTFDAVTVAFGVRNFENLDSGLKEIYRVLKPGAQLIVLEFSKPKNTAFRKLYNLYMGIIAPEMAGWFSKNKKAYQYLNDSAKAFPDRQQFVEILERIGFTDTECKPLSLGICCIYCGRKPGSH